MKISETFRKRAFYGVAIFCITAIATVGALSIGGNEEDNTPDSLVDLNETNEPGDTQVADGEPDDPEVQNPEIQVGDTTGTPEEQNPEIQVGDNTESPKVQTPDTQVSEAAGTPDDTQEPKEQETSQVAEQPADDTEVLSPVVIAEQLNFDKAAGLLWPISGEVIIPYSPDHGVYYQTLDQFSASEAVVLSSTVGTEVKAAAKGVVTAIEEDVRIGTTVTLALGNDTSLVYGQLDVADLKEGDVLEAGECIGTVAEPTRYYVVEGPNLYFKVMEGEESIDPAELLKTE